MIIRKIDFLVCMLVVCSLNINTAMAQSRSYEGGITVNPVRLEQKGDFIHVDESHSQFFCHIAGSIQIGAMRIE